MGVASRLVPFGSVPPLALLQSPAIPSSPVQAFSQRDGGGGGRPSSSFLLLPVPAQNKCCSSLVVPAPPTLFHHIAISVHGKTNSALLVSTSPGCLP